MSESVGKSIAHGIAIIAVFSAHPRALTPHRQPLSPRKRERGEQLNAAVVGYLVCLFVHDKTSNAGWGVVGGHAQNPPDHDERLEHRRHPGRFFELFGGDGHEGSLAIPWYVRA